MYGELEARRGLYSKTRATLEPVGDSGPQGAIGIGRIFECGGGTSTWTGKRKGRGKVGGNRSGSTWVRSTVGVYLGSTW